MDSNGLQNYISQLMLLTILLVVASLGCSSTTPKWIEQPWTPIHSTQEEASEGSGSFKAQGSPTVPITEKVPAANAVAVTDKQEQQARNEQADNKDVPRGLLASSFTQQPDQKFQLSNHEQLVVRTQDAGYQSGSWVPPQGGFAPQQGGFAPQQGSGTRLQGQQQVLSPPIAQQAPAQVYNPNAFNQGTVQANPPQQIFLPNPAAVPREQVGDPNESQSFFDPVAPVGNNNVPPNFANLDVQVSETQTGRVTFGAAVNSNSGVVGQIIIDERNFDILGFPRSFSEIQDGTAFRGRGQGFRLELVPGNEVQRYLVNFSEPYLFNSQISFSASGYFFDRQFFDWDEQRLGGRFNFGYRLTPDLSFSAGLRLENVNIRNPRVPTSPSLDAVLGDSSLFLAQFSLINDTRDHPFLATQGSYLELSYFQGFGDFDYPRGELDYRRYFLLRERPDQSGRHTLSIGTKVGVSGTSTPIFENFFVGGFATLRGFEFRNASPVEGDVRVGGRFQWLNTVEYTFPITADDMFKGVVFCDFGTVEENIEFNSDNFRVAPGFGFRVHMPFGGSGGAPLAFDFAFPVEQADTDETQTFSFYTSVIR